MSRYRFVLSFVFLFMMALGARPAEGQEIGRLWKFTPELGQGPAFEAAFAAHMEFRKSQGDPWDWQIYQVVVGEDVGSYYAASWNHEWADFDAYEAFEGGAAMSTHFQATVTPTLKSMTSAITDGAQGISKLPESPDYEVNLINVTDFYLLPGKQGAFNEALRKFDEAIKGAGLPFYYTSDALVSGGSGPVISIAGLGSNWADFAETDPNMEQVMLDTYGEEEAMEIFTSFSDAVHHWESFVVRYRADLSNVSGM